ncbi:hypothetical protein BSKO_07158 [Bryopsis sp. KO-2023]|nr:hypothetical protein BSKO_07158 [Bryopsis sp. KO-2023]
MISCSGMPPFRSILTSRPVLQRVCGRSVFHTPCPCQTESISRIGASKNVDENPTAKGVTVYFRTRDVFVEAAPGDNILEVANRCDVDISTGCLSGSCGSCEVEVTKYEVTKGVSEPSTSVVRACIAGIPRGYNLIEIDDVEDPIWGADGMDL